MNKFIVYNFFTIFGFFRYTLVDEDSRKIIKIVKEISFIYHKFWNVYDFYYFLSSLRLWKDNKILKNSKKHIFG